MIPRHQLAVSPDISLSALARAAFATMTSPARVVASTADKLLDAFGARECLLTDSGTSALVTAMRSAVGEGGIVALPGYGCIDFASAVQYAGVRVRLYDVDPLTLSADLDSLERALHRGAGAIVVAHYYGYAADVVGIRALARRFGVPVIEDAAQAAGATLHRQRLGTFGDLSILSFGRGKGLFGGGGGAVLTFGAAWSEQVERLRHEPPRRGFNQLLNASAQWLLARPRVYAIPASIPRLRLGEMVYHPAHEPAPFSAAGAALVGASLRDEPRAVMKRRLAGRILETIARQSDDHLLPIRSIDGADPGFLRVALLDRSRSRRPAFRLGIMRGYPLTLHEQRELAPSIMRGEPATPGASELRDSLFTLPTHSQVVSRDVLAVRDWMCGGGGERNISANPSADIAEFPQHGRRGVAMSNLS